MSKSIYKIGIDVGGTNTDGVLVNLEGTIVAKTKQQTTQDLIGGISDVIGYLLKESKVGPEQVEFVMLGTTHCTNAIVERKNLNKIGIIRICKPASIAIPPLTGFPEDLIDYFGEHVHLVKGGYEFDGRLISPLDEQEVKAALISMKGKVDSLAITGIFSKSNPEQERQVKEWALEVLGDISVSLSHAIGGLGLLERENATILNACLQNIADTMAVSFENAVKNHGIDGRLFISQNDGTLMSVANARDLPVLTIACGPTNSIRGGGALSGLKKGIVIDVGGTTTDAGILIDGFPRESSRSNEIGGVRTNFRMPDILSIGLGGGSIVNLNNDIVTAGPTSVGYKLKQEAITFGGETMTMTGYALLNGSTTIAEAKTNTEIENGIKKSTENSIQKIKSDLSEFVQSEVALILDKLKTENTALPVILVGGGSIIIPNQIEGASEVIQPENYEVANAYGVSIAKVGGESEQVFNLSNTSREDAIEIVKKDAIEITSKAGASANNVEVLSINETPLAYLPNMTKIKVKVCANL